MLSMLCEAGLSQEGSGNRRPRCATRQVHHGCRRRRDAGQDHYYWLYLASGWFHRRSRGPDQRASSLLRARLLGGDSRVRSNARNVSWKNGTGFEIPLDNPEKPSTPGIGISLPVPFCSGRESARAKSIMKPIPHLQVDLPRIDIMRSAKCLAIV